MRRPNLWTGLASARMMLTRKRGIGMSFRNRLAGLAAITLAACSLPSAPDEALLAQSDHAYADLVLGHVDALLDNLPEEYHTPQQRKLVANVRGLIPSVTASPGAFIGWNSFTGTGGDRETVEVRYDYGNEHLLVT